MAFGPTIIFDKSSLESLNLNEAVFLDNFYRSNITPLFVVECLADLEKQLRQGGAPEQHVRSLATRTPVVQSYANVHHRALLDSELRGNFRLDGLERPVLGHQRWVQLEGKAGLRLDRSPEEEALSRWCRCEFLDLERQIAKKWRREVLAVDHATLVKSFEGTLGAWRSPQSLEDARCLTDTIVDNVAPARLLRFGTGLLGLSELTDAALQSWEQKRRPQLRTHAPFFVHVLSLNIFFALVLPTQLLRNVKQSHRVDLAYMYYLPFCSVFTSKDRFHAQVAPLFISAHQTFVEGHSLKEDLAKLNEHYSALPPEVTEQGLWAFAMKPPDNGAFLVTRLWDKYLPDWRNLPPGCPDPSNPSTKAALELTTSIAGAQPLEGPPEAGDPAFVTITRRVPQRRGKWRILPQGVEGNSEEGSESHGGDGN